MQNLKQLIFFLFLTISLIFSCRINDSKIEKKNIKDDNKIETKIINDVFLNTIDTPYYPYDNFLANDLETKKLKNDTNLIAVSNKLEPFIYFLNQIKIEINDLDEKAKVNYLEVFHNYQNDTASHSLCIDSIKNIGRFQLTDNHDFTQKVNYGVLGSIQFSRIALNTNKTKALFVVTIKDKIKSSVEMLVLLERINGQWKIFKSILLSES